MHFVNFKLQIAQFSYSNYTIKLVYTSTATLEYMRKARTFFVRAVSASIIDQLKLHDSFCLFLAGALRQLSAPRLIQSNNYVPGGISCAADLTAIFRHKISVSGAPSGKRQFPPELLPGDCGQARRPLRHPGGGHSGRLHPVSAPGRRRLPPQIPGDKRLKSSAACRPCKGQQDKHPLLGDRTENHQPKVFPASGRKSWDRFSFYAAHMRYGNFSPAKRKSSSASHDIWQRRRAFVMESFCFNYSDIRSDLHGVP